MTEELIRTPGDLRPGDIFIGPIGGLAGLAAGAGMLLLGESFRVGPFSARHMGMITMAEDRGPDVVWPHSAMLSQAMPGGAETVALDPAKRWTARCAYVRLPETYPGQMKDAAAIARLMVREGVGYSFASYPSLALYRLGVRQDWLLKRINRRRKQDFSIPGNHPVLLARSEPIEVRIPVEAICSVFVDQALTLAGVKVMQGVRPQAVTPGALAEQLLSYPGATWCLPGPGRSWVV